MKLPEMPLTPPVNPIDCWLFSFTVTSTSTEPAFSSGLTW